MNSAAMKSFTPRLTIIVLMLFVHASGQKLDEDLELEESPAPTSTLKCSLVPVYKDTSMLGSGSSRDLGSGADWLYPDESLLEASSGSGYPFVPEYSLVCDSLLITSHTEEMSSLLPTSSFIFTTSATVSGEFTPTSSLSVSTSSVSSSAIPIPSPAPEDIVEVRLFLSELQHSQLQDSESPERAALEAALVQEYLQALNSSEGRTKRQAQPSVVAKITEIGSRNSTTGETPISFYIIDGYTPVPATIVVAKLNSLSLQEIGGYLVISITVPPGVTMSAEVSPTGDSASQSGLPMSMMGGVVAISVMVCIVAVLLVAVLAFALNRKFDRDDHKHRDVSSVSPMMQYELDLIGQMRTRRQRTSYDYFPPEESFFDPPENLPADQPDEWWTSQTSEWPVSPLHERRVRNLHEWQVRQLNKVQVKQPDERQVKQSDETQPSQMHRKQVRQPQVNEGQISRTNEEQVRQPVEMQAKRVDERQINKTTEKQVRQVDERLIGKTGEGQDNQHDKKEEVQSSAREQHMVEQEVAASKPKRTVSFLAPSTELRSSEVTITPSFSIVSNLSQISQSELDLDISQPQASQSQQKA